MMVEPTTVFTAEDFRRRASAHIPDLTDRYGDHRLNPEIAHHFMTSAMRDAAVLVPVIDRGAESSVLLTRRSAHLRQHPGQIAFPGGRVDPDDSSQRFTALRETHEEIGLAPSQIELVGEMPYYYSASGFRIRPVLSVLQPDFELKLNEEEVDEAFEVPLSFLMNPANHQTSSREFMGFERFFLRMPFGGHNIWGVTAGIVHMLYERLYGK